MESNVKAKYALHWLAACILAVPAVSMTAQLSFSPPDGGWNYIYEGDKADYAPDGEGFASLDGTWSQDNGRISGTGRPLVRFRGWEPARRSHDYH